MQNEPSREDQLREFQRFSALMCCGPAQSEYIDSFERAERARWQSANESE